MADETGTSHRTPSASLCVVCHIRPQTERYRPFCSKRCADIDLHRWLDGVYAIPVEPDAEEDELPAQNTEG
ncbi:MAG TPA: DNA gyrase inhibitor YacG [Hyphomicrobiales bacterium]|nr:DNA gyrase inhibitor YacG [Hyphomicrobiales bacterium]